MIMVYELCKKLKELGTKEIVIGGHSRGAILTLMCASEKNAKMFRNAGVVGYVSFNPMPVQMEPLTKEEPVILFTGTHDTVCPANLVNYYYEERLQKQPNVYFKEYNYGHWPFAVEKSTKLQSFGTLFAGLIPHKGWAQTLSNNVKNTWFRVFGGKDDYYLKYDNISQAQNFTNACVVINKKTFRPLVHKENGFELGEVKKFGEYKKFLEKNVKAGVVRRELIQTQEAAKNRLEEMLNYMCDALKIYKIT